jgi:hypothetical protein
MALARAALCGALLCLVAAAALADFTSATLQAVDDAPEKQHAAYAVMQTLVG